MPDIEDSLGPTLGIDRTQYAVKLKSKRKNGETSNLEDKPDSSSECKKNGHCDSVLPWNRTIYLKTWGCSHNNSDTEYMVFYIKKTFLICSIIH
jgi:hypothetical protein